MLDKQRAINLIQCAELDIATFLQSPDEYDVAEYFESVVEVLGEALTMLGADPLPLE